MSVSQRPGLRLVLLVAGSVCVVLAALGAVLPVLPTTPFLLLAAAAFARSSERCHRWLLANRIFGPLIRDWQEHRAVPRKARGIAIVSIVLCLGSSIVFAVEATVLRVLLGSIGAGVIVFLSRLPVRG